MRVLVLPAEWAGKRTIRYVDPADEEKPKLQRARIYFERAAVTPRAAASCSSTSSSSTAPTPSFCVPGESYLAVLDGLYDSPIRLITCRHEAGAANMADAYGKLTGRPGICHRHARARARRTRRSACTPRSRTRRR